MAELYKKADSLCLDANYIIIDELNCLQAQPDCIDW